MKEEKEPRVGAIIVAAGESQRMGGIDKMRVRLGGKPVLARVIDTFQSSALISQIVVVVNLKSEAWCQQLVASGNWPKVSDVCPGGERRQDSVSAGLEQLGTCDWIIIHDGARPLVTADLIKAGLEAAKETGSAVAAVPVKDTIKIAGENKIVHKTPVRSSLWLVQTPQVFRFDVITEAYRQVHNDVTDDASLVEQLGRKVKLYPGSYDNIKITTPDDLALAGILLQKYAK